MHTVIDKPETNANAHVPSQPYCTLTARYSRCENSSLHLRQLQKFAWKSWRNALDAFLCPHSPCQKHACNGYTSERLMVSVCSCRPGSMPFIRSDNKSITATRQTYKANWPSENCCLLLTLAAWGGKSKDCAWRESTSLSPTDARAAALAAAFTLRWLMSGRLARHMEAPAGRGVPAGSSLDPCIRKD